MTPIFLHSLFFLARKHPRAVIKDLQNNGILINRFKLNLKLIKILLDVCYKQINEKH